MYKNKFLIANPVITDPFFSHSVIFLLKHSPKGAEGICLNTLKEVGTVGFGEMSKFLENSPTFEDFQKNIKDMKSVPLYAGGPCRTPGIYFVHGYEQFSELVLPQQEDEKPEFDLGIPTSFGENEYGDDPEQEIAKKLKIIDGVYFGTPVTFGHIIESGKVDENKFRFYTGMSAWGPGQLEREIAGGAWKIQDADPEMFFDVKALDVLAGKVEKKEEPRPWGDRFKPSLN